MSGPSSSRVAKLRLSLAWPPVRWTARGRPLKSHFRWILVENPPRERPSAWPLCPLLRQPPRRGRARSSIRPSEQGAQCCWSRPRAPASPRTRPAGSAAKPLPDAGPLAKLSRQGPPGEVVNREIMQRLQELAVVLTAPAAARACRPECFDDNLPLGIGHLGQQDRLLHADPSQSLMPTDVNPSILYSPHSVHTT